MVPGHWYAVCESSLVGVGGRAVGLTRLGQEVVLWREGGGRVVAAVDRCPHKGARLSPGRVVGGALRCPYHGFHFEGGGQCAHIPVQPGQPIPSAMHLSMWSVAEAHGLVWLWSGPDAASTADPATIPWFSGFDWPDPHSASGSLVYPVHYSRMIESNFDVYHFPYVHGAIDPGLGSRVEDFEMVVEGGGAGIRTRGVMVTDRGKKTPFAVDFLAPNVQRLSLLGVAGVIISTPMDAGRTWVWARYRQGWTRLWPLSRWLSALSLSFEWRVVQSRQDIPVLGGLTPREAEPGACVWVGVDAGAARYVQWRSRQLRLQRGGGAGGAGAEEEGERRATATISSTGP